MVSVTGRPTAHLDNPSLERTRINFRWLLTLRWAAIGGQLATIAVVEFGLGVALPLALLLSIIMVTVITNGLLAFWFRRQLSAGRWLDSHQLGANLLAGVMLLDIVLLSSLLALTGGLNNPFAIFYLVNISLAAIVLRPRAALMTTFLAIVLFTVVMVYHRPLAILEPEPLLGDGAEAQRLSTALQGFWVALTGACLFIVYFTTRVTMELERREQDLSLAQEKRAQSQKLEALATLAAGAAHELASPLSTIAVIARELEVQLQQSSDTSEGPVADAQVIRREVTRCRGILDLMAAEAGESVGEEMARLRVEEIVDETLEGLRDAPRVEIEIPEEVETLPLRVPRHALVQSLRALLRNALEASGPERTITWAIEQGADQRVRMTITDQGVGMPQEILDRVGEPFFTTREPGQGMGLGIFLARKVIERIDGTFEIRSVLGQGTTVLISLPPIAA